MIVYFLLNFFTTLMKKTAFLSNDLNNISRFQLLLFGSINKIVLFKLSKNLTFNVKC
jgi:hypothetical protein